MDTSFFYGLENEIGHYCYHREEAELQRARGKVEIFYPYSPGMTEIIRRKFFLMDQEYNIENRKNMASNIMLYISSCQIRYICIFSVIKKTFILKRMLMSVL